MSGFLQPYADVRTSDGHNVTLLAQLQFVRPLTVGGQIITVPAGATSDGASIPQQAWNLLPPFGPYWLAAVVHDSMYRGTTMPRIEARSDADLIFFEAMLALGVELSLARVIYNAVDRFGHAAWDEDRRNG